jgi:CCR4-NOT transcription complex subunit 1
LQRIFPSPKFFQHLRKVLGLSLVQEVVFAIALHHSQNSDISTRASEHIQKQLPELIKNYVNAENNKKQSEEGLHDSSPEILHLILTYIFEESTKVELSLEAKEKFLKSLKRDFPRELVPVVLAPLLYPGDGEDSQKSIELNMAANQMVRILKIIFLYSCKCFKA